MANFALDVNSPQGEIISSLNYALVNLNGSSNIANVLIANPNGSITNSTTGAVISWQYRYINIRYAQNATGSVGFSSVPTNATYYGIQNTPDATPSTVNNPANYTWTQVAGGFGTNKFLFYKTVGGYQIEFYIGVGNPGAGFVETVNGQAIDLTVITAAQGTPGSNGVTVSVTPSQILFPQQANYKYTPTSTIMTANFVANLTSITSASIYANVDTGGNVTIGLGYIDPSIQVTSFNSNTNANVVTINFTQANTSSTGTGLVSVQSIGNTNPNVGVSTFTVQAYTLANATPYVPINGTGSWNFATGTGTPPQTTTANYVKPVTIDITGNAGLATFSNVSINGYNYYTWFQNYVGPSGNPVPTGFPGSNGATTGGGYDSFRVGTYNAGSNTWSGNVAYCDVLLVAGGAPGSISTYTYNGNTYTGGGSGGNIVVVSNVALNPGLYTVYTGAQASSALWYSAQNPNGTPTGNAYTLIAGVTAANTATSGPGYGGGINGSFYSPTNSVNGANGTQDPWGTITWVGQQLGGVTYFGGGGGVGANIASPPLSTPYLGGIGGGAPGGINSNVASYATFTAPYQYDGYNGGYEPTYSSHTYSPSGGGGGGRGFYTPDESQPSAGYGDSGIIILRQFLGQSNVWTLSQPTITATQQVYSSSAIATTANNYTTANVVGLTWSTPVLTSAIAPPSIVITYPQGQYITNNQGVYTPTPVANVVTLNAQVQALRGNSILASTTQVTSYFTANGNYSITSNLVNSYNPSFFTFSSPTVSTYNVTQNVTYSDIGGTASGFISEALLVTTKGNTGQAGFVPLAYVIANVDPTTANTSVLSSMYAAPRNATYPPGPIGVGILPAPNDVAQFFLPNVNSLSGGITSVLEYDGTSWSPVTAQVISGGLIVTGTITTSQLNANEVWTLQLQSTNANFGNIQSPGFWLASQNGDAHFAGNVTIGANLNVVGLITQGNLNANTVSTTQLAANAVVQSKLAFGSVGNNQITSTGLNGTLAIAQRSLSNVALALGTLTNAEIASQTITGTLISQNTITGNLIALNTITGNLIVPGTITGNLIHANTITGNLITANTITANSLLTTDLYTLNVQSFNATFGVNTSAGYWLAAANGNARFGGTVSIGNNLTVGDNATIGNNLTVGGLITAGALTANTVSTTNLVDGSVTISKLGSGVGFNVPFGTIYQPASSYTLTGTGSYDYVVPSGTYAGFYAKKLAWNQFSPTIAQVNRGVYFKIYFTFNLVASGYPYTAGGETALMCYTNTGSAGGYNTVNFNSGSSVINLNVSGPDTATFSNGGTGSYSGVVVFGNGNYPINSGVGDLAVGSYDTIGLVLLNSSGAGSIAISNLVWTVTYP